MKKLLVFCLGFITLPLMVSAEGILSDNDLKVSLEKYLDNEQAENKVDLVRLENGTMELNSGGDSILINYKEENNKFICEYNFLLKDSMSYENYEALTSNSSTTLLCYSLAADILDNVDMYDTMFYTIGVVLEESLKDIKTTKFLVLENDEADSFDSSDDFKYISKSEFPTYALEYAKSIYDSETVINDKNHIDSFTFTNTPKEVDNGLEVTTNLTIDLNADFRKVKGTFSNFTEGLENAFSSVIDTPTPIVTEETKSDEVITNTPVAYNSSNEIKEPLKEENPQTGVGSSIMIYLSIVIISGVSFTVIKKHFGLKNF